ncbi:Pyridoxal-dependent decarboxylase [Methanocorpusculum labreanum Z]|uniref:Probable L-tyrosine/L-aspartate decarboxylase n=1 Tax=Methanocorpusculum labreanum (strain ATCC 43576 / DSM 4855 / Z) TaxID=410358 RepID=MFNA_METLZ|nr:tyrosine decarboxylase MfnA [Methanocorpusculum labreanum]A2STQ3.1 RecName: Full=Probable L-tyrosine/L-aspartate decarboxylase; Short=TDC/ADC [Methanocorpusculum labreanum Z]ABN07709.1 Pyridoxal-dependent decarboxylase [Methanocorpusculum labreanum Z]
MEEKGCKREEVISLLSAYRAEDLHHDHILSSMCTIPHEMAVFVHGMFSATNLGDPGLFPGTTKIEDRLVHSLGELMHHPGAGGYATSGGTESNLQAIRIAKKLKPEIKNPNIVVPASAHFSFDKTCDILGLEMRTVPYGKNYTVDCDKMAEMVDKNTISVSAIAGTTEYGMIDDVERIAKIALENDLFFHVDAAFGGMVIPFLPNPAPFDFEVPGVSSISLDPHKMGMSTIPCGCLLLREPEQFGTLNVDTPYLTVKKECTLAGTRPGADVAGAYAVIKLLGREGFRAVVAGCMENTRRLIEGMEAFGYTRAVDPVMNVATFEAGPVPKGWIVSHTRAGHLRFVVMPHVTRDVIENFLADVAKIN